MVAENQQVPSVIVTGPSEDPPEENMDLDEMLNQEAQNIDQEHAAMEALCIKVSNLGKNTPPEQVEPVFRRTCMILTDIDRGLAEYEYQGLLIKYIYINKPSVDETKNAVMQLIEDPAPKSMILSCFSHFILERVSADEAMTALRHISFKMLSLCRHNLVISSCLFPPSLEVIWPWISGYNFMVRNLNITMRRNPLCTHKALMKTVKYLSKLVCKGSMWTEHQQNTGLGSTLSPEGWAKLDHWYGECMLKGMEENVDHNTGLGSENGPAPLCQSPGFKSKDMVRRLQELGTYNPVQKQWTPKNKNRRNKENDSLRADLSSINRRPSTSSSNDSRFSGSSMYSKKFLRSLYSRLYAADRRNGAARRGEPEPTTCCNSSYDPDEVIDHLYLVEAKRDIEDLTNINKKLKDDKEKEEIKRRVVEDKLTARIDRLQAELDWQAKDRRRAEDKVMQLKDDLRCLRDEKDDLKEELRREKHGVKDREH